MIHPSSPINTPEAAELRRSFFLLSLLLARLTSLGQRRCLAHHQIVARCRQVPLVTVFGQIPMTHLVIAALPLALPNFMFHFRGINGPRFLCFRTRHVHSMVLIRSPGKEPLRVVAVDMVERLHQTPIYCIGEYPLLLTVEQSTSRNSNAYLDLWPIKAMHQYQHVINPRRRIQLEVSLRALATLVYFWVALSAALLGWAWRGDNRGINHSPLSPQNIVVPQMSIHYIAYSIAFQTVTKVEIRAPIGQPVEQPQARESANRLDFTQGFFHGRIAQVIEQANAVRYTKSRAAGTAAFDYRLQNSYTLSTYPSVPSKPAPPYAKKPLRKVLRFSFLYSSLEKRTYFMREAILWSLRRIFYYSI